MQATDQRTRELERHALLSRPEFGASFVEAVCRDHPRNGTRSDVWELYEQDPVVREALADPIAVRSFFAEVCRIDGAQKRSLPLSCAAAFDAAQPKEPTPPWVLKSPPACEPAEDPACACARQCAGRDIGGFAQIHLSSRAEAALDEGVDLLRKSLSRSRFSPGLRAALHRSLSEEPLRVAAGLMTEVSFPSYDPLMRRVMLPIDKLVYSHGVDDLSRRRSDAIFRSTAHELGHALVELLSEHAACDPRNADGSRVPGTTMPVHESPRCTEGRAVRRAINSADRAVLDGFLKCIDEQVVAEALTRQGTSPRTTFPGMAFLRRRHEFSADAIGRGISAVSGLQGRYAKGTVFSFCEHESSYDFRFVEDVLSRQHTHPADRLRVAADLRAARGEALSRDEPWNRHCERHLFRGPAVSPPRR